MSTRLMTAEYRGFIQGHEDQKTAIFNDFVAEAVASGKTAIVRWIPTEAHAECQRHAPAWNAVVRLFADHPEVVFGDVNLKQQNIQTALDGTDFAPGKGGWPTLRYFSAATGVSGAPYRSSSATGRPSDELATLEAMRTFVEEAAVATLCEASTGRGCDARELEYAAAWRAKTRVEITAERRRLEGMLQAKLGHAQRAWVVRRRALVKRLLAAQAALDEL